MEKFTKTCKYCGAEFQTVVYWARFCSANHRTYYFKAEKKRKAEKQTKPNPTNVGINKSVS